MVSNHRGFIDLASGAQPFIFLALPLIFSKS